MAKSRFERNQGFGPLGMLFLAAVLYLGISLAIGFTTKDEHRCRTGYEETWRFAPPGWVCD
jgi:hypothetical protein